MSGLLILLPLYNDWTAAARLLQSIQDENVSARVLIVNDGSSDRRPAGFPGIRPDSPIEIEVLHLKRNIGHQRAIATGLVYAYQNLSPSQILIMDSDGEDRPQDMHRLLAAADGSRVVFAARIRRSESLIFRISYQAYRGFHLAATGIPVRVGNFSLLPFAALESLVVSADLWNHYAAAVFRTNLPRREIPCPRGERFHGESRMNFISLVVHGLSALSVFADVISTRLLAFGAMFLVLCLFILAVAGGASWGTWLGMLLLLQLAITASGFCFLIISARSQAAFLPLRDCPYFFSRVEKL